MRIVVVTTSWPAHDGDPSGHFVRTQAREVARGVHELSVLTPKTGGAFGWPGVAARLGSNPVRALEAMWWVTTARRKLARLDADLVIAHWALPCGWPIAAHPTARLEVHSHGGDVRLLGALPAMARKAIVRKLALRASSWTFASSELLAQLLRGVDTDNRRRVERIACVHAPPIELPDVSDAIARLRRSLDGSRLAVCAGRLVRSKRVDRVLRHVAAARNIDSVVIVGDGPERQRLQRLARTLGVNARFLGAIHRNDALAWIGAANLLLHASEAEGLSTVVREAEALGTQVVRLGEPWSIGRVEQGGQERRRFWEWSKRVIGAKSRSP
jgi:glycosyltransferase involved in cell wall biosynthesis